MALDHIPPFTSEDEPSKPELHIFVSYCHKDKDFVNKLITYLRMKITNIAVWHDEQLSGGQDWWDEILKQIAKCDIFILVLSRESAESRYCMAETTEAWRLHKRIIPILIGEMRFPDDLPRYVRSWLERIQFVDNRPTGKTHDFDPLVIAVKTQINKIVTSAPKPRWDKPTPRPRSRRFWIGITVVAIMVSAAVGVGLFVLVANGPLSPVPTPSPSPTQIATTTSQPFCIISGFEITDASNNKVTVTNRHALMAGQVVFVYPIVEGCDFSPDRYVWQLLVPVEQIVTTSRGAISYIVPNATADEITLILPSNAGTEQVTLSIEIVQP